MFIFFHFFRRCFAAEVWDAKGLAVPTLGYDALTREGARGERHMPQVVEVL